MPPGARRGAAAMVRVARVAPFPWSMTPRVPAVRASTAQHGSGRRATGADRFFDKAFQLEELIAYCRALPHGSGA